MIQGNESMTREESGSMTAIQSLVTDHALKRMRKRGIRNWQLEAVLEHGKTIYIRGACILAIGAREVARAMKKGIDLRGCDGIQAVTCPATGGVMTVYRNRDFRGMRPRRSRPRRRG